MLKNFGKILKPFANKNKEIAEALDHLSAGSLLLFPVAPGSSIAAATVLSALSKSLLAVTLLLSKLPFSENSSLTLNKDHDLISLQLTLLIQKAYFQELVAAVKNLPNRNERIHLPPNPFSILTPNRKNVVLLRSDTLDSIIASEELFRRPSEELAVWIRILTKPGTDNTACFEKFDKKAREAVIKEIDASPVLSQRYVNNSLRHIITELSDVKRDFKESSNSDATTQISPHTESELSEMARRLDQLTISSEKTNQLLADTLRIHQTKTSIIDVDEVKIAGNITDKIKNLFDSARRQLREGSLRRSEAEFEAILSLTEGIDPPDLLELRARSNTNIGVVNLIQGDIQKAKKYFDLGYSQFPDNPNILALKGLSLHLDEKTDESVHLLEKGLQDHPDSESIIINLAQVLSHERPLSEVIDFLRRHPTNGEGWYEMMARVLSDNKQFEEALEFCEQGLENFPDSLPLRICKATTIAIPLTDGQLLKTRGRSPEDIDQLNIAEEILADASKHLRQMERAKDLFDILLNRSAILLTVGKAESALTLLKEAEVINPSELRLLNLLGGTYLYMNQPGIAVKYAEKQHLSENSFESLARLSATMTANGDAEDALNLIRQFELRHPISKDDPGVQSQKLEALQRAHYREEADKFAHSVAGAFPENSRVLSSLANFHHARNDLVKYEDYNLKAIKFAESEDEKDFYKSQVAQHFYNQKKWQKVIDFLPSNPSNPKIFPYLRELAHSHLELGNIDLAYNIAKSTSLEDAPADLLEIRSWIELRLYQYEECRQTLKMLARKAPRPVWLLMIADASNRLGNRPAAYGILRDLYDQSPNDIDVVVMVSQACYHMGYTAEAFQFAKSAYSLNKDDQRAKNLIVQFLLARRDDIELPDEDRATLQECLKNNDSVEEIVTPLGPEGEIDISPILDRVKSVGETQQQIMDLYHRASGPIGMLAHYFKSDVWLCWKQMTSTLSGKIYMTDGSFESQSKQLDTASSSSGIVIDFSALLTLNGVNLLHLLSKRYEHIYISSDTINLFQSALESLEDLNQSEGRMAHMDGKFYYMENSVTPEEHKANSASINSIISFVSESNVESKGILPATLKLIDGPNGLGSFPQILHLPIAVAHSLELPLYTDQGACSSIGSAIGIDCFCTQDLLRTCLKEGLLSSDAYEEATMRLIRLNYSFVSISSSLILKAIELDGGQVGENTGMILSKLPQLGNRDVSVTNILGITAAEVWHSKNGSSRDSIILSLAEAAGVYDTDVKHMLAFLGAATKVTFQMPSSIFGIIGVVQNKSHISKKALWKISLFKFRLPNLIVEALSMNPNLGFPRADWNAQKRLQQCELRLNPPIRPSSAVDGSNRGRTQNKKKRGRH